MTKDTYTKTTNYVDFRNARSSKLFCAMKIRSWKTCDSGTWKIKATKESGNEKIIKETTYDLHIFEVILNYKKRK